MPPKKALPGGNACIHWSFTLNNPAPLTKEDFIASLEPYCRYAIVADEVAASGTPHFQGYMQLNKKARFASVQKIFTDLKPHLEPSRGSSRQNIDYCKKGSQSHTEWENEGTLGANYGKAANFVELGKSKDKGHRTDRDSICDDIVAGKSLREVALEYRGAYLSVYRGIERFQQIIQQPPRMYRENLEVHLYYGKTGTGKTFKAIHDNPGIYKKPIGKSLWFDGFPLGCKAVLLDECCGQFPLNDMLMLLDKYAVQVEMKGSHSYLDVDLIILTTNIHPALWYKDKDNVPYGGREEQGAALFRRFTKIFWFRARDDVLEIPPEDHSDFFMNFPDYL